jgi:hypothetical protein
MGLSCPEKIETDHHTLIPQSLRRKAVAAIDPTNATRRDAVEHRALLVTLAI